MAWEGIGEKRRDLLGDFSTVNTGGFRTGNTVYSQLKLTLNTVGGGGSDHSSAANSCLLHWRRWQL